MKTFSELRKVFVQKQNERLPPIPKRLVSKPFFVDTTNGVFGVQKPRPIDRAAAMMLAKSRWTHAPAVTNDCPVEIKKPKKKPAKKKPARSEPAKQEPAIEIKQTPEFLTCSEALYLLKSSCSHNENQLTPATK
jgi:hypothetical protein